MESLEVLLEIAQDLTSSLASHDRYDRLLQALQRILPYDAACILRLEGQELVPVAAHGLPARALQQRFNPREHPRLAIILGASEPVRFSPDTELPDPFEGLLGDHEPTASSIHACLGCPLTVEGRVVGALTADALKPYVFDDLDPRVLATLAALAGAALRTTSLIEALERTAERRGEVARELQRHAARASGGQILGESRVMHRLLDEMSLVAGSGLSVLIHGETGVGKELVAHGIHEVSPRREEALIHVNCAALPESLAESELFGHTAGAFTGAVRDRAGKFEIADGGTLFLDEVGELPLSLQPKLLRALQRGEIQRVGSDRVHQVNVRMIAATNRDLEREVAQGRFRADLYHRLAVYPLRVPPLRERREDIGLLARHFLEQSRRRLGLAVLELSPEAAHQLREAAWPGNVRELENALSRGALRASRDAIFADLVLIEVGHLSLHSSSGSGGALPSLPPGRRAVETADSRTLRERVDDYRREQIRAAVASTDGNWAAAARELGMHRSNLHQLAQRLGLRP